MREVAENRGTVVITLNGEARAVLQDIREYEKTQESLALLKFLACSRKSFDDGKHSTADASFSRIRKKIAGKHGK